MIVILCAANSSLLHNRSSLLFNRLSHGIVLIVCVLAHLLVLFNLTSGASWTRSGHKVVQHLEMYIYHTPSSHVATLVLAVLTLAGRGR